MRKLRNIIVLLIIAGSFWYFYGDAFTHSGISGVYDEIRYDLNRMRNNPTVNHTIDHINKEIDLLFKRMREETNVEPDPTIPESPELDEPTEQVFSIHNIELNDSREMVEQHVGPHQRSSLNEYGVDWTAYHENYHNFFLVAYDENNLVAGLYTNQNLLTSTEGINFESSRSNILAELGEPLEYLRKGYVNYRLQDTNEYDMFRIHDNYVTIFYDLHQNNRVTGIQIIRGDLEEQKETYFAEPSDQLKTGFEYQLFDLTNAARVKHDLSILSWDERVRETAYKHSNDMAENNYFGHNNLDGLSPFDRLTEDAISYRTAGENLAAGQISSVFAHEGLMNSLGHRENKLNDAFESLGIGVAFNEESQPYYTEKYLAE